MLLLSVRHGYSHCISLDVSFMSLQGVTNVDFTININNKNNNEKMYSYYILRLGILSKMIDEYIHRIYSA